MKGGIMNGMTQTRDRETAPVTVRRCSRSAISRALRRYSCLTSRAATMVWVRFVNDPTTARAGRLESGVDRRARRR
eukprot:scaffold82559_cov29-Tisochrysis_lutea.AAC.5